MPRKSRSVIHRPAHKPHRRPLMIYDHRRRRGRLGRNIRRWWRNRKEKNKLKSNIPRKQLPPETSHNNTGHPDKGTIAADQDMSTVPTIPIPPTNASLPPSVEIPRPEFPEPEQQPLPEQETRKLEAMTSKPQSKLYVSLNRIIDILRRVHRPLWSLTMLSVFLFMFMKGRISDETIVELMKWIVSVYVAGRSFEKASFGVSSIIGRKREK